MTSWSRRLSNAESRQGRRETATPEVALEEPRSGTAAHGRRHDDGPIDEGPFVPDTGARNRAEDGLTGEQVRTILTDTLVETPDMVAVFASVGREALWANDAFVTLIPIREVDKIWLVELLDEWSKGHYEVKVLPALVKFGRWRGRLTFVSDDGLVPVSAVIVAHRDRHGEIATVSLVARDLSELRSAQEHVSAAERRFAALVENVADLIAVADPDGTVQYLSPAATRILGYDEGELDGRSLLELVHPDDAPADLLTLAKPDDQGIGSPVELRLRTKAGTWRHLEAIVTDLSDNPAISGIVLNARDVTERVEAARLLANRAFSDPLTGLPNQVRLLDRLASALADPTWAPVAVMVCDIDQFKPLNTVVGREGGDQLLRTVADRLSETLGDRHPVARLGGDAFAVILAGVPLSEALSLAAEARRAVAQPIQLDGRTIELSLSAGIAVADAVDGPEALVHDAELAMGRAKQNGGDRTEVFAPEMAADSTRRENVQDQLRHALQHDGVRVHFQPIVDIATEQAVGAESLLRVHDDGGVLLSPAEFVEAAESSGLISRLGLQVLQMTAEQLATWSASGQAEALGELSVNISPRQLADPDLPGQVEQVLAATGVEPARLGLEITESILISAEPQVDASIAYLRSLGVRIGLDDFGTGQSSLGYLKRFPLDFVKIDRSLVAGIGLDEHDTAIVRATIELGHNLGLVVTAVGVETEEQLEALGILGCDRAQGYLFAPALPADQLLARLGQMPR
jgi:diguanylate cyclase (GGDEF)-like protein/PAS domain S-box-containing protein